MSSMTLTPTYVARPRLAAPRGQLRLTRRGRLVLFVLALAFVLVTAVLLSTRSVATGEGGQDVPTQVITVDTGETLWGIAAELTDNGDVRSMVDRIEQLNALETSMLYAGQELFVPVVD